MKALSEKGKSWYSCYRACEFFLLSSQFQEFEKLLKDFPHDPHQFDFPGCLLLLYRNVVQTHPNQEMRQKCVIYMADLLDPNKWGNQPDLQQEVTLTLNAIETSKESDLLLHPDVEAIMNRYYQRPSRPVEGMIYIEPPADFPSELFEEVRKSTPIEYLREMERISTLELKNRGFINEFDKILPLTLETGNMQDKVDQFLEDKAHDFLIVNGSHGCGKTFFSRYLEWFLWNNFNKYHTIPLYMSLENILTIQDLTEGIPKMFHLRGCEKFLDEAKRNYKVLLIVDHCEAMPQGAQLAEHCNLAQWERIKVLVMNCSPTEPNLSTILVLNSVSEPFIERSLTVTIKDLNAEGVKEYAIKNIDPPKRDHFVTFCERPDIKPLTTVFLNLYLLSKAFTQFAKDDRLHLFETFVVNWLHSHNLTKLMDREDFYCFMEIAAWYSYTREEDKLRSFLSQPVYRRKLWNRLVFDREFPLCRIEPKTLSFEFSHQDFQNYFLGTLFIRAVITHVKNNGNEFLTHRWEELALFPFDVIKEFLINAIQTDPEFQHAVKICMRNGPSQQLLPLTRLTKFISVNLPLPAPIVKALELPRPDKSQLFKKLFREKSVIPARPQSFFESGSWIANEGTEPHLDVPEFIDMRNYPVNALNEKLLLTEKILLKHPCKGDIALSLYALFPSPATINCYTFSSCGRFLAFGAEDKKIHVCNIAEKKEVTRLNDPQSVVKSIAFSPDLNWVAWGDNDLHVSYKSREATLLEKNSYPSAVLFTPDSSIMITGNRVGEIKLWKSENGRFEVKGITGQNSPIISLACGSNNTILASAHSEQEVCLWQIDPKRGTITSSARLKMQDPILSLVFHKDQNLMIKTTSQIIDYHTPTQSIKGKYNHSTPFLKLGYSDDHLHLFANIFDNRLAVWSVELTMKADEQLFATMI